MGGKDKPKKGATGGVFVQNRNLPLRSIWHAAVRVLRKTKFLGFPNAIDAKKGRLHRISIKNARIQSK